MTDSEYERLVDARVQRALKTDPRYVNAENAEEQAEAEEAITAEAEATLCAMRAVDQGVWEES